MTQEQYTAAAMVAQQLTGHALTSRDVARVLLAYSLANKDYSGVRDFAGDINKMAPGHDS